MASGVLAKTGPTSRFVRGKLIEGHIELTSEYIGFRPLNNDAEIGFLQWYEFKSVRILKQSYSRPAAVQISRTGGNLPLILCVPDIEAWVGLITEAHTVYIQSRQAPPLFSAVSTIQS